MKIFACVIAALLLSSANAYRGPMSSHTDVRDDKK
uniref:SAGE_M_71 n=2 Tax=Drosophila pseudoobscura TaxID=7237 RepID=B3TQE0_9MUSC|nr:SAGE_M_71 [Drosophila pseudoobscura]